MKTVNDSVFDSNGIALSLDDYVEGEIRTGYVSGRISNIFKGKVIVVTDDETGARRSGKDYRFTKV